jgi:hypothetical protein
MGTPDARRQRVRHGISQCWGNDSGLCTLGSGVLVFGGLSYAIATVYEIATAPSAARDAHRREPAVGVVPIVGRDARGGRDAGLALVGRF